MRREGPLIKVGGALPSNKGRQESSRAGYAEVRSVLPITATSSLLPASAIILWLLLRCCCCQLSWQNGSVASAHARSRDQGSVRSSSVVLLPDPAVGKYAHLWVSGKAAVDETSAGSKMSVIYSAQRGYPCLTGSNQTLCTKLAFSRTSIECGQDSPVRPVPRRGGVGGRAGTERREERGEERRGGQDWQGAV
ncbi:hypothetical protein INR49_005275 [Caranx melampygus]|nr:hypothetical protein INR49_005275 [Caranx melampygus]